MAGAASGSALRSERRPRDRGATTAVPMLKACTRGGSRKWLRRSKGRKTSSRSGADTGPDVYSHEGEEAGLVITGQIELTVAGETRLLKEGDAYHFNSRLAHRFRNPGSGECVIVSAATPPTTPETEKLVNCTPHASR